MCLRVLQRPSQVTTFRPSRTVHLHLLPFWNEEEGACSLGVTRQRGNPASWSTDWTLGNLGHTVPLWPWPLCLSASPLNRVPDRVAQTADIYILQFWGLEVPNQSASQPSSWWELSSLQMAALLCLHMTFAWCKCGEKKGSGISFSSYKDVGPIESQPQS